MVNEILEFMRKIHYIKDTYLLEDLAEENSGEMIWVDESLLVQEYNVQIWVAGLINSQTRKIRLEILDNRTSETLKIIINRLAPKGNTITTDVLFVIIC